MVQQFIREDNAVIRLNKSDWPLKLARGSKSGAVKLPEARLRPHRVVYAYLFSDPK